jgi:hypothetical protein
MVVYGTLFVLGAAVILSLLYNTPGIDSIEPDFIARH